MSVSCYGKLPFHREFLRVHLDSPGASGIQQWIEDMHDAISRSGSTIDESSWLGFAAPTTSKNDRFVAGIVRQSSDGQRIHPVTLFCEYEVAQLQARWHLALLAVATAWTALHELSCRSFSDVAAFNAALAMDGPAIDLEAAEASYRSTCAAPCSSGPWRAITDTADEDARHFAFNLTTLIDAQRAARPDEAVAIGIPLVGSSEGTDVSAALWTELLRAAIVEGPLPTVVIRAPNRFLCAFYRRVDGEDLAGMLSDAFDRIDRVDERWQTLPNADSQAGASLDRLVSTAPASLAELVSRVQSFERR